MSAQRGADTRARVALPDGGEALVRIIVNPRASRILLRLDHVSGDVVAVAPNARSRGRAEAFAREQARWIAAAVARAPRRLGFIDGASIPLRGTACVLRHVPGRAAPRLEEGSLIAGGLDAADFARRVRRTLVRLAREDLTARVAVHAAVIHAEPSRISVKDTRSRWGSCSRTGALAFSWRVILAPPPVLDYLAAHEVAHLREMNHGPRFWALVAQTAPHHASARAWLKRHGPALHVIG